MKRVLIVGCGDVARRAFPWLVRRFRVYAVTRRSDARESLRAAGVTPLLADLDDRRSLERLGGLADYVLHFAPPAATGDIDVRTRRLIAALRRGQSLPHRIVYISTTGVYGDCMGEEVDETSPCRARTARALRRVDAERRLRDFARRGGASVVVLRAPGIYAAERLPLQRLERALPVLRVDEDVHTNHVHADDLARAACMALFRGGNGRVYNAADRSDLRMGEYFDLVADLFDLPRAPRMSRQQITEHLSPMALSFMSESRRVCGERLRREFRLRFEHPTVRDGLLAALRQIKGDPAGC